ncbi:uncharacterized protein LOC126786745 [Argentina anserina]|uniref:uncharacterized protein LOC126786745 n=1 Tax=Argentina anserina TaxID=57926 RepID=UPI0021762B29|nr:uncharacterized protein LOC126786745 [Potentilla anserina]
MPRTYTRMTCQVCFKKGHNRKGCPITKAKNAASKQPGEGSFKGSQQTRKRDKRQQAPKVSSKGSTSLKDQIIKSKKAWNKRKTMEAKQGNAGASSSQAIATYVPQTQSSQNPATKMAQTESEWAGF